MTYAYVEVSKNVYPYRTLHVDTCGVLNRVNYRHPLSREQVGRYDGVRTDYCGKCMPRKGDKLHPAVSEFYSIQRAFRDAEAETWRKVRAARKVIALRLALEEAEKSLDMSDPQQVDFLNEYDRTGRSGDYRLPEVTVGR